MDGTYVKHFFHFEYELNNSLQLGDTIYYVKKQETGQSGTQSNSDNPTKLGKVGGLGKGVYHKLYDGHGGNPSIGCRELGNSGPYNLIQDTTTGLGYSVFHTATGEFKPLGISKSWMQVNVLEGDAPPRNFHSGYMLLFGKDNRANLADLNGYYALLRMSNDSLQHAELFQVGSELFTSSGH